jgi:3',5'-cyclic AMP phosphodiesterase CpdA
MSDAQQEQVKVCHFSDLHLPLPEAISPSRLVGKRLFGYANLRFRRAKTHRRRAFVDLLGAMSAENADMVVFTGDMTNFSLACEFQQANGLFADAGLTREKLLVVPGNHDRYTVGADLGSAFESEVLPWLPSGFLRSGGYPIVRKVGPVVFAALDTAVWRSVVRDAGRIDRGQMARLRRALADDSMQECWPVVLMHHPPFRREPPLRNFLSGLAGAERLLDALSGRDATVLHGHIHRLSRRRLGGLDIIGVPSASNDSGNEDRQLAYHVYTFSRHGLVDAEIVRHWPGEADRGKRFERLSLPASIGIQGGAG